MPAWTCAALRKISEDLRPSGPDCSAEVGDLRLLACRDPQRLGTMRVIWCGKFK